MKEGLTTQVLRDDPSLMMKDLSKLKSNIEIYRHLLAKEEEQETKVEFKDLIKVPYFARSKFPGVDLTPKQCHFWFHGERNCGKTYLIE